ncbi:MAG: UvrD-helicase domain-containing protein [Candidatus Eisenbacteria bacterium]|nr:UvrD-helicase domain-containing protein [Candidatus Eisenbacteria bacterium]
MTKRAAGKGIRLTEAQAAAVQTGDRDLWLTAGAGSGKTSVLAERYLHLHLTREVPIRRILAITFTDKAAAEMRERIGRRLQEEGKADSVRELAHAPISTIDSFCRRLLTEYAERAGVDPDLRVLDEAEAAELQERVWIDLLDRWWRERPEETLLLFRELEWSAGADHPGGVDPSPLFALVRSIRTAGRDVGDVPFVPDPEELFGSARRRLAEATAAVRAAAAGEAPPKTREKLRRILALDGLDPLRDSDWADRVRTARAGVTRGVAKNAKEAVGAAIEAMDHLLEAAEELDLERPRLLLRELAVDFLSAYSGEKKGAGAADFLDLEEKADRLLGNERVREEVRRRFSYLLLDECQDTNELQLRLVRRLRGAGRFLAVGDAKQSIYAFRDADVSAFLDMGASLPRSTRRILLDQNFRSRPVILRWVNALVSRLWETNRAMGVPYEPLEPGPREEFPRKREPSVEILVAREESIGAAREREARLLARRLRRIREEGLDGLAYGDMAVLFRSTTDMALYERALRREGIPASIASGRGFFQTREVTDLLAGLSLVDDPYDDLRLAAALRSPLAGLDDRDLAQLLIERPRDVSLWDRARDPSVSAALSDEGRDALRRFLSILEGLRDRRGLEPADRILRALVEETGYLGAVVLEPGGLRMRANLRKLFAIARSLEERGELSLHDGLRALERYRSTRIRERESAVDEERDAVRLLTIHGAKGMEFPLVAVADLGRPPRGGESPLLFHKNRGIGVRRRSGGRVPYIYARIVEELKVLAEAEDVRLLYVALTRAERHLILSGGVGNRMTGWLARIDDVIGLPEATGGHDWEGIRFRVIGGEEEGEDRSVPVVPPRAVLRSPERFAGDADPEATKRVLRRLASKPPPPDPDPAGRTVTGVHDFLECPRRFRLARLFPVHPVREGGGGPSLGTRFHRAVESRVLGLPASAAGEENGEGELVDGWMEKLVADPRIGPLLEPGRAGAEVSFAAIVGGRPLRGAIDLLARTPEGWVIVDYKTDRAAPREIEERYRISLQMYAAAVRAAGGEEERVETWIWAARVGRGLAIAEDGDAVRDALDRYDRAEREGDYPARRNESCRYCLYRRGCPEHPTA